MEDNQYFSHARRTDQPDAHNSKRRRIDERFSGCYTKSGVHVQHIRAKGSKGESIADIAMLLSQPMASDEIPTICVMNSFLETKLMERTLSSKGLKTTHSGALSYLSPDSYESTICVTTFEKLREVLCKNSQKCVLPERAGFFLDLGCNNHTVDMVIASGKLLERASHLKDQKQGNAAFTITTVSNSEESVYSVRHIHKWLGPDTNWPTKDFTAALTKHNVSYHEPREGEPPNVHQIVVAAAVLHFVQNHDPSSTGMNEDTRSQAALVLHADPFSKTFAFWRNYAPGVLDDLPIINLTTPFQTAMANVTGGPGRRSFMIHHSLSYVGIVNGLDTIVVDPTKVGWFLDSTARQMVMGIVPYSKAEIEYSYRYGSDIADSVVRAHVMCPKKTYEEAPALPVPETHTVRLSRLMIAIMHLWSRKSMEETPIILPHQTVLSEYGRRLLTKGYVEPPIGNMYTLTQRGLVLAENLERFQNFEAACLVSEIREHYPESVKDTLRKIAAIAERRIDQFVEYINNDDATDEVLRDGMAGYGKEYFGRGMLWLALGLWDEAHLRLQNDESIAENEVIQLCGGTVFVTRAGFDKIKLQIPVSPIGLMHPDNLSQENLHQVEEALVRAWLHNLAFVPASRTDLQAENAVAIDIVSGKELVEETSCYEVDWHHLTHYPNTSNGFAIYTSLKKDGGDYVANDLTWVSKEVVLEVTAKIQADIGWPEMTLVQLLRNYIGISR